ncbi:hypothetical protein ACQP2E_30415 [Actinoplanes sp. CA-015351]|uniref:hypothetical protein n=1 Tax=Actinoplanes sp. CA-015351 TaxID=3239897 RepID=UPI003D98FC73
MANDEQVDPETSGGIYASATADTPERRNQRRKQAVVAVVGAAAVLAGGGFLALQLTGSGQPALPEPAALAPLTDSPAPSSPAAVEPSVSRTVTKAPKPADAVEISPAPSPSPSAEAEASGSAEEQLRAAGTESQPVTERTELLENGTIRIVSAPRDLTGERELSLATDKGKPAGQGVKCTTKVRVNSSTPVSVRPTLLLCWRTSEARSVVTMAVVPSGEPPTSSSVEIIGKEWARLG